MISKCQIKMFKPRSIMVSFKYFYDLLLFLDDTQKTVDFLDFCMDCRKILADVLQIIITKMLVTCTAATGVIINKFI